MLDNVDIQEADYRVWRPQYNLHAYGGIEFPQKPIKDAAAGEADGLDLAEHVADHHVAVLEDRRPMRAEE
jgi:hypothetical protein